VIYLHGALASGWILFLLAQVVLVFRRQVRVHQKLGKVGIYYALLVLAAGVAVTLVAPVLSVAEGRATLDEAPGFLILPIGDLLLFAYARVLLMESEVWLVVGRRILTSLMLVPGLISVP